MKATIFGLFLAGLLAGSTAEAVPVTVAAGQSVLWNFDNSGYLPHPPYTQGDFLTYASSASADAAGVWDFFADLNGAGAIWLSAPQYLGATTQGAGSQWLDGIFSARLTMNVGSISVNPCFTGYTAQYQTPCGFGTIVGAVPEPGTLALLGLGLAGLGLGRKRRAVIPRVPPRSSWAPRMMRRR